MATTVQPGHHSADRRVHDLGDLFVGEALDVGQVHRQTEVFGDLLQRTFDVRVGQMIQSLGLGRSKTLGSVRLGTSQLIVLDIGGVRLQGLALLLAGSC